MSLTQKILLFTGAIVVALVAITLAFTITTDRGETFGPFELPDANNSYNFEADIEAQTVRFNLVDTTGGNTGVVDIVLFGEFVE